jgi:hypothetical protein
MKIHGGLIECFFSVVGSVSTTTTSQTSSLITTTDVNGSYSDQQHQIWVVGSSPPITNQNQQFPAMWHVVGSGTRTTQQRRRPRPKVSRQCKHIGKPMCLSGTGKKWWARSWCVGTLEPRSRFRSACRAA